jgi:hypothetical protein
MSSGKDSVEPADSPHRGRIIQQIEKRRCPAAFSATRRTTDWGSARRLSQISSRSRPAAVADACAASYSTSGSRSAPFGHTMVPASWSTKSRAKKAGSRSAANTPVRPRIHGVRSTVPSDPSVNRSPRCSPIRRVLP